MSSSNSSPTLETIKDQFLCMELPMGNQENQSVHQQSPQPKEVEETIDSTTKEDSGSSSSSSTITDVMDDDGASSPVNGPLYELSDLMAHLPIKRGLSKYYEGKSQSFTSMESVRNLEDLAKKGRSSYNNKKKMCKRDWSSPKPTIAKKSHSRGSFLSTMVGRNDI